MSEAILKSINKKLDILMVEIKALGIALKTWTETLVPHEEYKEKKPKKLPKSAKKLETERVYNFMGKTGPYICKECKGLISWDLRPDRIYPLHVDQEGHIKGTGDCPNFLKED